MNKFGVYKIREWAIMINIEWKIENWVYKFKQSMQSQATTGVSDRRELSSDCNTLELNQGKATSLLGLGDNHISTNSFLSDSLCIRLLFKMLTPCPLSLIFTIVTLATIPTSEAYPLWMYGWQLGLVTLTKMIKEIYFEMIRVRADGKVNESRFLFNDSKVYRDGEEVNNLKWGNIREGDILYLQKGEKAPADLLVLDTQYIEDREAVVYVDARSITGRVTVERKKACYLTQVTSRSNIKRNWDKYKRQYLTGKLKYQLPNANMEDFLGYLKLVKDPKTSQITFENFISRESLIKTCWVYALVLHAGMNCKIMRHIGERNRNHLFFQNYIDRIYAVCVAVNLLLGLFFSLVTLNEGEGWVRNTAYHFLLFSVVLPNFLYLGNALLVMYFSYKNNTELQIINYSSVINLGSLDYAVLAYSGVLNSGKMIPDQIVTASSIYDFRQESREGGLSQRRRNAPIMANNEMQESVNHFRNRHKNRVFMDINSAQPVINTLSNNSPATLLQRSNQNSGNFDTYFLDDESRQDSSVRPSSRQNGIAAPKLRMQLQPLRINREKLRENVVNKQEEALELVKAFALCHQAILKSTDTEDILFEANSRIYSEEVLLKMVNNIGVHVSSEIDANSKKEVGLKLKLIKQLDGNSEWFFTRRINTFGLERRIFSVVVRQEGAEERVLYCKGTPEDMLDKLRDRQLRKSTIERQLASFKHSKAQVIIYGKRTLFPGEYELYDAQFTKIKMSSSVTAKELEDFSCKFERDLQFVSMVGLSSQKNEAAREMTEYLVQKGIRMCFFTNNLAEIQSLKALLESCQRQKSPEYVELYGRSVEEIRYNLNSITRKLTSQREYLFSLVLGPDCWAQLKAHSSLMQHFLFALYYSDNILTYSFSPLQKAELSQKLKNGYNRPHTLMSIGSSYSDLLFENYSDVSLIISSCDSQRVHSDIPSDIRVPSISYLRQIIELGSWVTSAYHYLIHISIYRAALITTIALVIEIRVCSEMGTSYNLDGTLTALYVMFYGAIETIFTIKLQQRRGKELNRDNYIKEMRSQVNFWTNLLEGLLHGTIIAGTVLLVLPNARLAGGKLFPVQGIHFSIYLLMINASILRHLVNGQCSKWAVLVLALLSYPVLLGVLWLVVLVRPEFQRTAVQMGMIWTCYDTAVMVVNATAFSMAVSLFIAQSRKTGMMRVLADYYLSRKKVGVKAKQLLGRDISHVALVKHLFREEENIEESIQELVRGEFDTNELKMGWLLEIKKMEHRIKNEFNNVLLNLTRFQLTLLMVVILYLTEIVYCSLEETEQILDVIPLYISLACLAVAFFWSIIEGERLDRRYYQGAEITLTLICLTLIVYEIEGQNSHFLLSCLSFIIFTQLLGARLGLVVILSLLSYITGAILCGIDNEVGARRGLKIMLMAGCGIVNFVVLYGSTFDSRKNYILREQIEMQTNQTNDIWTILVPEFVRTFFSENGEDSGQYRQNSVAILFCYVCNFDSIIEEEKRNVVRILDDLYRQFDKLCSSFAVQKIQTVGYTYMAATGIKKIEGQIQNEMVRRNKVQRLVNMGQQMLEKTRLFKWGTKKNKDLEIKIGIHMGEVVVGVIGKHKKQFSLIGTNVNATSRHGSTGSNGSITLSREARSELHSFTDEAFLIKEVYMKGLCKTDKDTIPVFTLKNEQAGRKKNRNSHFMGRFRELVMKVIRSHRLTDQKSSDSEPLVTKTNIFSMAQIPQGSLRDMNRRTTCRGLENNFNKIEEMKNRQDELKCYSWLLEFNQAQARDYFEESYPGRAEDEIQVYISKEQQLEEEYCDSLQKNRGVRDQLFIIFMVALNGSLMFLNFWLEQAGTLEIVMRVVGLILMVLLFWLTGHSLNYRFVNWIFVGVFTYQLIIEKNDEMHTKHFEDRIYSHFYVMMLMTVSSGINGMRFLHSMCMGLVVAILGVITCSVEGFLQIGPLYQWIYVSMVLIRKYAFQKESIINFRQGRKTAQISNQLSKIVSELLPKHAYEKLKTQNFQNRLELTDLFQHCTILFADIKGFTEFSDKPENKRQPQNVVRMLKSLFQEFDVLCTQFNVYKVYTIGDCYVVLGFTNCYDRNPVREAQNVVKFSFEMLKTIDRVKKEKPALECLNMRIGIHTGTIIGGIVGTEIVRYDIYGSDVVVANKFEQTGKVGEIHISEETKKLLDQLTKKPYSENNIYASEKVEVKKLNISYKGYFIKRGNLS